MVRGLANRKSHASAIGRHSPNRQPHQPSATLPVNSRKTIIDTAFPIMSPSQPGPPAIVDRKSTRLNSSHGYISYAVFCLKKKKSYKCANRNIPLIIFKTHHKFFTSALNKHISLL